MNNIKSLLLLPLLAACAGGGQSYHNSDDVPKSMARVIVYQPSSMRMAGEEVDINGSRACSLSAGRFFQKDLPPGETTISSSVWSLPGTSRLTIHTVPAHKYYVRLQFDTMKGAGFGAFGLAGALAAEGVSNHGGPFVIETVDDAGAQSDLSSLTQNNCN